MAGGYGGFPGAEPQGLAVNGENIGDFATIAASLAPFMRVPARRGDDVVVPGRHGALLTPNKPYDVSSFTLPLLVRGSGPDGRVPADSTAQRQFYANAARVVQLFQQGDTVGLTRTMPDGTQRQADAVVTGVLDFSRGLGNRPIIGRVNVALRLPGAFWSDIELTAVTGSLTSGGFLDLDAAFGSATAPISDLVITLGPGNNPTIIQGSTFFAYDGVIAAGRQLVIDCGSWDLLPGNGQAWNPDERLVRYSPGPPWFELDPNDRPVRLALTHTTGSGVAMAITVSGRRKYLNA